MNLRQSCLSLYLLAHLPAVLVAGSVSFNKDIRPILSDKCFHCHGFDEKERKGDLRLDLREAALKGGKEGPAFVPGKPQESALIQRITATDADEVMPPPKLHKAVTKEEAALLAQWIAEGAEYQGHWAFLKPERPTPPLGLPHAVDGFIQDKLAKSGLKPAPEASRETLVRRATLDLTGLPPSPAEVAEFLADQSPTAYEKLLDRLLASPRYGEHMAARWMDMARYADSNGFQSDTSRQMWPWRDWLIKTLNANLPFDQFTIQQLAGDLLPEATKDQITATGFHRNHRLNGEGGRIVEEWFAETVIDRVETTGMTWLALTFNCCRCHDHKYDPISQKEFYQMYAYFNSCEDQGVMDDFGGAAGTRKGGNSSPVLDLPSPEQEQALAEAKAKLKEADDRMALLKGNSAQRQKAWEEQRKKEATPELVWAALENAEATSRGGATLAKQADGSWLASGALPEREIYEITSPVAAGSLTGLLLECLPDASLPQQSVGRAENGNFVLSGVEVSLSPPGGAAKVQATLANAEADYSQADWDITNLVNDQKKKKKKGQGWAVDGPTRKEVTKAVFHFTTPLVATAGATLTIRLKHEVLGKHAIGKFRLATSTAPAVKLSPKVGNPPAALAVERKQRTPAQQKEIAAFFRDTADTELAAAGAAQAAAKKHLGVVDTDTISVMVLKEAAQPRQAFVFNRGEYDKPGDKVERVLPKALPPMAADLPNNRLGLAKWLVSGEHPLTGRVWVNRAWETFFGTGLVKTSENFGSQADWPSHPELLDWLATEFVRLNWDMKAMHKLLLTSHTYKQDSRVTEEHIAKDLENRLLARGPRLRLSGEALRDQALALSGLLVEKIGGPSVKPYMPAAVWDETSVYGDMRNYQEDTGDNLYRRSLYTIWKRTAAPPSMLLFDSPSREICMVKRSRSNTPTQALSLLNEVTYVEAARKLAERMLQEGGPTPAERLAWAFRAVVARNPSAFESAQLLKGLEARLATYAADPTAAGLLLKQGAAPVAAGQDPATLAAYTVTANVLLNLDEVVTRN